MEMSRALAVQRAIPPGRDREHLDAPARVRVCAPAEGVRVEGVGAGGVGLPEVEGDVGEGGAGGGEDGEDEEEGGRCG